MKSGSDLKKRIYFFELLINNMSNSILQKTNNISWVAVFEVNDSSEEILGISQSGEWVYKDNEQFYVLKEKSMYLYCVKLLEVPYDVIQVKIEARFKRILIEQDIRIIAIFPFFEIVEFAFSNLLNDYWFNLAWKWYEKFSFSERYELIALLSDISRNKKFSQRNRQRVIKEMREIEKRRGYYLK